MVTITARTIRMWGQMAVSMKSFLDSYQTIIDRFLAARHTYGHGPQIDYFDHFSTVGWTRLGTEENPGGMAVVMSNSAAGKKKMKHWSAESNLH